ncbi:MAG: AAA family ATPase [Nanobdellota archaeon]
MDLRNQITDPALYPEQPESVELIETHISYVCLVKDKVYKFKKAVNFGFLDFSTLEKRRFYCEEELRLNRRLSPNLYEGLVTITADGCLEGEGAVTEYGIRMRRMPQEMLLSKQPDRLTPDLVPRLVDHLLSFYALAASDEHIRTFGELESFKINTDENFQQTGSMVGELLSDEQFATIRKRVESFYVNRYLFEERLSSVRECHGDLHTGNIFLSDDFHIFDCIEFNDRLKNMDIACDIAFLCMDLDFHGLQEISNQFLKAFVRRSADWGILAVINFYKCYRAYVRGKITGFQYGDSQTSELKMRAQEYFSLAHAYAKRIEYRYQEFPEPTVILMCGLPGSGKSYIAHKLARFLDVPLFRSDVIRKRMSFSDDTYTWENRDRVYDRLMELGGKALNEGKSCILDATFLSRVERDKARALGPSLILYPIVSDDAAYARLSRRNHTVSEADCSVYDICKQTFEDFSDDERASLIQVNGEDPLSFEGAYSLIAKKHLN